MNFSLPCMSRTEQMNSLCTLWTIQMQQEDKNDSFNLPLNHSMTREGRHTYQGLPNNLINSGVASEETCLTIVLLQLINKTYMLYFPSLDSRELLSALKDVTLIFPEWQISTYQGQQMPATRKQFDLHGSSLIQIGHTKKKNNNWKPQNDY